MFEQNNVGVRLTNPIVSKIASIQPNSPEVKHILNVAEKIATILEGKNVNK